MWVGCAVTYESPNAVWDSDRELATAVSQFSVQFIDEPEDEGRGDCSECTVVLWWNKWTKNWFQDHFEITVNVTIYESYDNMYLLVKYIQYKKYSWDICGLESNHNSPWYITGLYKILSFSLWMGYQIIKKSLLIETMDTSINTDFRAKQKKNHQSTSCYSRRSPAIAYYTWFN
jgi:hypothetical protein